ncbi:MAG: PAS domain S-box protein [Bacteroidales bacterium]|nr:PAS domain S-box protein [Bacteroidales bacterium]
MTNKINHLLIVEDDRVDQMAFERYARTYEFPFTYQLVGSVMDAKEVLKNQTFDAIVTDFYLGDGTAFEILELKKDIPIVIVTGTGTEEIAVKALKQGAYDYIIKDVEGYYLKMLTVTVQNALLRFKAEKELKEYHANLEQLVKDRTIELHKEIEVRKQAEETIRESEIRYRTLFETAGDAIFMMKENKFIACNNATIKMFGCIDKNDILDHSPWDFSPIYQPDGQDSKQKAMSLINAAISSKTRQFYWQHIKKDGTSFDAEVSLNKLSLNENKFVQAIVRDITKNKKLENKLKDSVIKYRTLFENSSEFLFTLDLKGNFTDVNKSAEILTGHTKSELLNMNFKDYTLKTEHKKLLLVFNNIYKTGIPYKDLFIEARIKDNLKKFFEISLSLLRKGDQIIGFQGSSKDITERKLAEEKLIESEKYFRALIENSNDVISILDEKGNIIYESPSHKRVLGYNTGDLIGKNAFEFVHSDDRERISLEFTELLNKPDEIKPVHFRFLHKDGTWRFLEGSGQNLIKAPEVKGIVINYRDVTERKRNEKELQKLNHAIEQSPVCVMITDIEGNIEYANQQFSKLTGYSVKESIGKNPRFLNAGTLPKEHYKELWETINTGKIWEGEFHNKMANGELFWENAIISPVKNNAGQITNFVAVKENITEKKKMWNDLVKAKEKAEESDRLKTAFLHNISHEIRTPMNGILGFTTLLLEPGLTGEEQNEYIEVIKKSGDRMLNTVNNLMDISMIESNQVKISMSDTDVNEQINNLFTFFKPEVEIKGIQLFIKLNLPSQKAIIKTDKEKLNSILTNLLKNAIKYTFDGKIEFGYILQAEGENTELEFFVKDTGIGIPKDRQQAIFKRFVQADIEDKSALEGTGLGLSISKSYVEMLGGKIRVESQEGKGTQFYFTIPYNAKQEDITIAEDKNTPQNIENQISGLKILIAEDVESADMFLTVVLKKISKEILHAKTGIEVIDTCRKNPDIDLILMDIKMPEMNGYEATKKIRESNKDVVIIAQTAYALYGDNEKAIESGCNDYISKPINRNELLDMVKKLFSM